MVPHGIERFLDIHESQDRGAVKGVVCLETCNDPKDLVVHVNSGTEARLRRG